MFLNKKEKKNNHHPIAIQAPCGSGKTTSTYLYMTKKRKKTIMIVPNKTILKWNNTNSIKRNRYVSLMTASRFLHWIIYLCKEQQEETVINNIQYFVIDDAHVLENDYQVLFIYLRHLIYERKINKMQVVFLSSKLNYFIIKMYFKDVEFLNYDRNPLFQSSFVENEIKIIYDETYYRCSVSFFLNEEIKTKIFLLITKLFSEEMEKKMLCFLATKKDCFQMKHKIKKWAPFLPVFLFYDDLSLNKKMDILHGLDTRKTSPCLILATESFENSFQINNLDIIIDSCISIKKRTRRTTRKKNNDEPLEYVSSSRNSIIQRSGRWKKYENTEKKQRIVYRMIGEHNFLYHVHDNLPFPENEIIIPWIFQCWKYSLDSIALFGIKPVSYLIDSLQIEGNVYPAYNKTSLLEKPNHEIRFLMDSPLEYKISRMMYALFYTISRNNFSEKEKLFIFFSLAVHDFLIKNHFPRFSSSFQNSLLENIFSFQDDILISHCFFLIYLFSLSYDKYKEIIKSNRLRFYWISLFFKHLEHISILIFGSFSCFKTRWFSVAVSSVFSHYPSSISSVIIPTFFYSPFLHIEMVDRIRYFYLIYSHGDIYHGLLPLQHHLRTSTFHMHLPNKDCISFSFEDAYGGQLFLWCRTPSYYYQIRQQQLPFYLCKKREYFCLKQEEKNKFSLVLKEIEEEVAFRPNKAKMLEVQEHFLSMLIN